MEIVLVATVTAAALHAVGAKQIHTYAGPWNVWIEKSNMCREDDERLQLKFSHYNPNKKFGSQTWTGSINVSRAVDDSWWVKAPLSIRSNNQWKENAFVFLFPRKGCSNGREVIPADLKKFFAKDGSTCLLKQQVMSFQNTTVKLDFPMVPRMIYGHYRLELEAGPKGERTADYCIKTVVHVIPKV